MTLKSSIIPGIDTGDLACSANIPKGIINERAEVLITAVSQGRRIRKIRVNKYR